MKQQSDLLITNMITVWIGRHNILLPINQNFNKIRETKKPSIERWTILINKIAISKIPCMFNIIKLLFKLITRYFFAPEAIRSHILQWSQEKNRRLSDGYDFEVICP